MSSSHENLGPDPSMDEILSSIRRILREDGVVASTDVRDHEPAAEEDDEPEAEAPHEAIRDENPEGVFVLDPSMLVPEPRQPPPPKPAPPQPAPEPAISLFRGGPTLDDIVRAELRPILQAWLNTHLPPLIDRIAREEIARLVNQSRGP